MLDSKYYISYYKVKILAYLYITLHLSWYAFTSDIISDEEGRMDGIQNNFSSELEWINVSGKAGPWRYSDTCFSKKFVFPSVDINCMNGN